MTLHKVDDELVIVHGPGGDRAFQKETIPELAAKLFNFKGQFGDPGRFSTDDVLLEPDGTEYSFGRDGLLSSITDSNGNTIRLNYTAGRLTSAVHSNGDSFTFVYNAQGRISQVTDQAGRATAYDYDAAGEHLLQVTGPQGTVAYTVTVQPTAGRSGSLGAFL